MQPDEINDHEFGQHVARRVDELRGEQIAGSR